MRKIPAPNDESNQPPQEPARSYRDIAAFRRALAADPQISSAGAKLIGIVLLDLVNEKRGGFAWPSYEYIAAETAMSVGGVRKAIAQLDGRYFEVGKLKTGTGRVNTYKPIWSVIAGPTRGQGRAKDKSTGGRQPQDGKTRPEASEGDPATYAPPRAHASEPEHVPLGGHMPLGAELGDVPFSEGTCALPGTDPCAPEGAPIYLYDRSRVSDYSDSSLRSESVAPNGTALQTHEGNSTTAPYCKAETVTEDRAVAQHGNGGFPDLCRLLIENDTKSTDESLTRCDAGKLIYSEMCALPDHDVETIMRKMDVASFERIEARVRQAPKDHRSMVCTQAFADLLHAGNDHEAEGIQL